MSQQWHPGNANWRVAGRRLEQERRYAGWRALLDDLLRRVQPEESAAGRRTAVDILACGIDGLGIQAVLEPGAFTQHRLERGVDALIAAVTS